jgi:hypothetical protein
MLGRKSATSWALFGKTKTYTKSVETVYFRGDEAPRRSLLLQITREFPN